MAFVVPDAIDAARTHMARFGSGPFFVLAHLPHDLQTYRGKTVTPDTTGVVGQWGDVQIEFVEQHCTTPSAYREVCPGAGPALHHVTVFVEDLDDAVAEYEAMGFATILYSVVSPIGGAQACPYAMMDTRVEFGVITEFYEEAHVGAFYRLVREAAENPDRGDEIRYFFDGRKIGRAK